MYLLDLLALMYLEYLIFLILKSKGLEELIDPEI